MPAKRKSVTDGLYEETRKTRKANESLRANETDAQRSQRLEQHRSRNQSLRTNETDD